jgi:transposase
LGKGYTKRKMPAPYSKDFRKKVIEYIKKGNSNNATSRKFDISPNTVSNWSKRYKAEGHYQPKKMGGKKGRLTREAVELYVKSNPNFILSEMGKHFNMTGPGALYWLKKLGYSYKKNSISMWKEKKKTERNT